MLRYAITDRRLGLRAGENASHRLVERCTAVAQTGVDFLLIREKDLPAGELTALARSIIGAVRATGAATKILIAGRVDIALAVASDGVHLSSAPGELTPAQVRSLMPSAFVSVSCHTLDEVRRARDDHASAILFAPVFGKVVDGREVLQGTGLEALREACTLAGPTPVFALGGITEANAPLCLEAGAAGIAAIRLFFG